MSLGGRTWLKRENQLPDFDLVTLRHVNALNDAAEGRWDLDHSFFRLKFHDRLAFRNLRTRRNHQPNEIPLMNVFALLDQNFFDSAANRRGHFDYCFIGLEFHHGLAFGNARSRRDHQSDEIALMNVFSEFWKLKFGHVMDLPTDVQAPAQSHIQKT